MGILQDSLQTANVEGKSIAFNNHSKSTFPSMALSCRQNYSPNTTVLLGESLNVNINGKAFNTKNVLAANIAVSTISFSGDTILDSASGFVVAGFQPGDKIKVFGSTANDGYYEVILVSAGVLTISASILNPEGVGSAVNITTAIKNIDPSGQINLDLDILCGGVFPNSTILLYADQNENNKIIFRYKEDTEYTVGEPNTYGVPFAIAEIVLTLGTTVIINSLIDDVRMYEQFGDILGESYMDLIAMSDENVQKISDFDYYEEKILTVAREVYQEMTPNKNAIDYSVRFNGAIMTKVCEAFGGRIFVVNNTNKLYELNKNTSTLENGFNLTDAAAIVKIESLFNMNDTLYAFIENGNVRCGVVRFDASLTIDASYFLDETDTIIGGGIANNDTHIFIGFLRLSDAVAKDNKLIKLDADLTLVAAKTTGAFNPIFNFTGSGSGSRPDGICNKDYLTGYFPTNIGARDNAIAYSTDLSISYRYSNGAAGLSNPGGAYFGVTEDDKMVFGDRYGLTFVDSGYNLDGKISFNTGDSYIDAYANAVPVGKKNMDRVKGYYPTGFIVYPKGFSAGETVTFKGAFFKVKERPVDGTIYLEKIQVPLVTGAAYLITRTAIVLSDFTPSTIVKTLVKNSEPDILSTTKFPKIDLFLDNLPL